MGDTPEHYRTLSERLDDLEKQVWKIRWGMYFLALAVASPKIGGPDLADVPTALIALL